MMLSDSQRVLLVSYLRAQCPWSEERIHKAAYDLPWMLGQFDAVNRGEAS